MTEPVREGLVFGCSSNPHRLPHALKASAECAPRIADAVPKS